MKYFFFLAAIFWMPAISLSQTQAPAYHDISFAPRTLDVPANKIGIKKQQTYIRKQLEKSFGNLPDRPKKVQVTIKERITEADYIMESFEFHNGVDAIIPGIMLIPKKATGKSPAILYHHYHGGDYAHGKDELFSSKLIHFSPGPELVKAGYIVMAIDAYAFGERSGKGPNGAKEKGSGEELSWAKMNTWKGRNLWGMMVRDDLMALDYLATRPEVDANRIGSIGLSLGCFRTFYVAALDNRVKVAVPVSCITRNADLIKNEGLGRHGIYYYVYDLISHFDTESIMACIAPRALLNLSGAEDVLEPVEGQRYINQYLDKIYATAQAPGQFRSIIYDGVGHEYTTDMWQETIKWLKEKL
ncbi:MAG: alpha/beta hydrolase family protein [Saprospiraceae bacterium]